MPRNHGEISVDDQSRRDNDNTKTRKKKKKKKDDDDDVEEIVIVDDSNESQALMPSISKARKRIRKRPKSAHKGSCFPVMRHRRREEEPSSPPSDPNDESFTPEMLRVMIETNCFFSNDCNTHG